VALLIGPPPPELARELEQVRSRARGLSDYLRSANAPLPEDFPRADILAIASEMAELPDGTAQGCLSPLEYADTRLADIRSLHFSAIMPPHVLNGDHPPALTREEGLDRDLSGLMVAVATARRVANRIAATEPEETAPEPSVHRETVSGLVEAESKGARLEQDLTEAREDFDKVARPSSERADHFRRTLTDARVIAGLSRVELAQENIIPAWLKRFGGWLSDYPTRLEDAGRGLEVGLDVVETVHGGWRRLKKNLTDVVYASLRDSAGELQSLGRRLGERRRGNTVPVEPFAISKVGSKILAGQTPPVEWAPFVDELDLSRTTLENLSAVHTLTALRDLDLSMTQVSDLSPLSGLTVLKKLNLTATNVSDLTPLQTLTSLEALFLALTGVSDLSPLKSLIALQTLQLSRTKVTDLSPLHSLTALQKLRLASTQVTDPSPLQSLTALKELDLSGTKISSLTPLQTLAALEILNLSETKLTDLCPLGSLTSLQSLDLRGMAITDLSPLKSLTALQSLDICQTKVADLSPLKSLTALQKLSADNLALTDLSPLRSLTALRDLSLRSTLVSDVSPLQTLIALQSLNLYSSLVTDLSPLKSLTALQRLDLSFTQVSDLSPLKALTALEHLDLVYTAVENLEPLSGLKSLRTLKLAHSKAKPDTAILAHLTGLQIET
jgi:Leucine-rich repeat (LRR) protein